MDSACLFGAGWSNGGGMSVEGETTELYDTATGLERGRLLSAPVLAFSPDGRKIAVQGRDKDKNGAVQLWDIVEVKKRLSLDAPPHADLRSAVFTPDGKQLAALNMSNQELLVWDAVTGKLRQRKKFPTPMFPLAYSPDGATLAVGRPWRAEAVLFDAATLKEKTALSAEANLKDGGGSIDSLGFSPDGRRLAGSYTDTPVPGFPERGLAIWDLSEPQRLRRLPTRNHVSAFAFAPDGKALAWSNYDSDAIELWDAASGRRLHQRPGHDAPVGALAVSPDGKILASGAYWNPTFRLWDTATGKSLRSLARRDKGASVCLFSADGQRMVSAGHPGQFQVWEAATGKELCHFVIDPPFNKALSYHTIDSVALSDDGKRLTTVATWVANPLASDSDVWSLLFIWDAATGKQLHRRPLAMRPRRDRGSVVQAMPYGWHAKLTPDGENVTVWLGDRLGIENISTKSLLATLPKDVGPSPVFSTDGRLLAATLLQPRKKPPATYDVKGLSLLETASSQEVVRLEIGEFTSVAFTPDGRAIVVADKQKLSIWDTATGERLHQMAWPESVQNERGEAKISSLAVLPGGRAATGMEEGDILVWDLAPSSWPVRHPARELSRDQFDALWSDLARDARMAYRAVSLLVAAPAQSIPFLSAHLHPATLDNKRIEKLLADLDDERYKVRESASRELKSMRYSSEPPMRRTLENRPSLEVRLRLENILAEPKHPTTESLQMLRAIAVLERIGTLEARRILEKLSGGATAPETRAAQAALQRLKYR